MLKVICHEFISILLLLCNNAEKDVYEEVWDKVWYWEKIGLLSDRNCFVLNSLEYVRTHRSKKTKNFANL